MGINDAPTVVVADARAESFDAFYRRERVGVIAVVYSLTGNRHVAEEISQEAFAVAHRRWATVATYDRPGDWVRRVALNRAISDFRRSRAEARAVERLTARTVREPSVEHFADENLWRAVRKLPARQAQIVALFYVEDESVERIAQILGCSEGTVKSHLHRARASLNASLQHLAPNAHRSLTDPGAA